jgi:hypothetical protein
LGACENPSGVADSRPARPAISHGPGKLPPESAQGRKRWIVTHWNDKRLGILFQHYNQIYWHGKIPQHRVLDRRLKTEVLGLCRLNKHVITIDCKKHTSDKKICGTLLHEMAHAAAEVPGHGLGFQAQLEKLLQARAPVSIGTGEAGAVKIMANLVPSRFPLLKQRMDRLEARRANAINRLIAKKKLRTETITARDIVEQFGELKAFRWKDAVLMIGLEYGLTDDTGRPTSARARRLLAKGRNLHRRARRDHLADQKYWKEFKRHHPLSVSASSASSRQEKHRASSTVRHSFFRPPSLRSSRSHGLQLWWPSTQEAAP